MPTGIDRHLEKVEKYGLGNHDAHLAPSAVNRALRSLTFPSYSLSLRLRRCRVLVDPRPASDHVLFITWECLATFIVPLCCVPNSYTSTGKPSFMLGANDVISLVRCSVVNYYVCRPTSASYRLLSLTSPLFPSSRSFRVRLGVLVPVFRPDRRPSLFFLAYAFRLLVADTTTSTSA